MFAVRSTERVFVFCFEDVRQRSRNVRKLVFMEHGILVMCEPERVHGVREIIVGCVRGTRVRCIRGCSRSRNN